MGYSVKWVENNLGITRKALRIFESKGLMPENKDNMYRDYSEKDIERIWGIRVLQGIGFTLKEIGDVRDSMEDGDWNFEDNITKKVAELEKKKRDIERHVGYAKYIKLTGKIPSRPKVLGSVKFEDFHEKVLDACNSEEDPNAKRFQDIAYMIYNTPSEDLRDTDFGRILEFFNNIRLAELNQDILMSELVLPKEILKRKSLGANHPEVQLLVKMIYDNQMELLQGYDVQKRELLTAEQFAKSHHVYYLYGDVATQNKEKYGKEGCRFIADAIAIFGGYENSDDPRLL